MTEIRSIRESEGEAFLQLLCDVYKLDFNRAYDLFFEEPMFDLGRKWALFEGQEMVSVLTTTALKFGWGDAIGIAGVATAESRRSEGHASRLIKKVMSEYKKRGEEAVMLFATQVDLYEKLGFEALDRVVRGEITVDPNIRTVEALPFESVRDRYDTWSHQHPDRLRRDAKRWEFWQWNYRTTVPFKDGYFCIEQGLMRECLISKPVERMPVQPETQWLGLTFMTDLLEIPLRNLSVEMYLMGYNVPGQPQLFLTDQF